MAILTQQTKTFANAGFSPLGVVAAVLMGICTIAATGPAHAQSKEQRAGKTGPSLGVIVAPTPGGNPLVVRVRRGSPADRAGVRRGDFVVSLAGNEITSPKDLQEQVQGVKSAEPVEITVWRNGKERTLEAKLRREKRRSEKRLAGRPWLGAMIRAAKDVGVEIARVYINSPAAEAGLQPADRLLEIGGKKVSSPEAAAKQIHQLEPGTSVELLVDRDGEQLAVDVEVGNLEDFHEQLFGKRFRSKFDDFHALLDPDFDGVPERFFTLRIPLDEQDEQEEGTVRQLLEELREELRDFREEIRESQDEDSRETESDNENERDAGNAGGTEA